jgi:hypothetical protein
MPDNPFAPVIQALAAQTRAINDLAREIKEEFAQYQTAVQSRDTKRASAIAAAINQRTQRLVEATEKLEASTPDAGVGGGPAQPGGRPDAGLPDVERPADPGFGVSSDRPDQSLPGAERPTDPGFGIEDRPPARPDQGLPPAPARPDQGLPPAPARPDAGLPPAPARPDQGLPPAPARPDQGLPEQPVDPGFGGGRPTDPTKPSTPPPGGTKPVEPTEPEGENKPVEPAEPKPPVQGEKPEGQPK